MGFFQGCIKGCIYFIIEVTLMEIAQTNDEKVNLFLDSYLSPDIFF